MTSTMTVIPYTVCFDGHEVDMRGIGGVASLPQYRRTGGIRACFTHALPDMYRQGAVFSSLYPFSNAFYRKFGYELGTTSLTWKLCLALMPRTGRCTHRLLERGSDLLADIRTVDRAFQDRFNLMTRDEDIEYLWVKQADPFAQREYTYVCYAQDQAPAGYLTFKPEERGGERVMVCSRFVFDGREGFLGLLDLLITLRADHSHALITVPECLPLQGMLPETSLGGVAVTRNERAMVRVINVQRALSLARKRGSGHAVIRVEDAQIPENDGVWQVDWNEGETRVAQTDAAPDVTLTPGLLAALLLGRYDASDLPWLDAARLHTVPGSLDGIFYRKPLYINRYF